MGASTRVAHYAAFLHENPGARRVWESREEWLDENVALLMPGVDAATDWNQLIFGYLNQLDQLQE